MTTARGIRPTKQGTYELTLYHPFLPKGRAFRNFKTESEAAHYRARMIEILNTGRVPPELTRDGARRETAINPKPRDIRKAPHAKSAPSVPTATIEFMLRQYLDSDTSKISKSDVPMVESLLKTLDGTVAGITTLWVDSWVRHMKRDERLAPGTIRKKVASLARAWDWWMRRQHPNGTMPVNPLRTLPIGYSSYGPDDTKPGEQAPQDVERNRRLHPGEYEKIESVLAGWQREDRERPWAVGGDPDMLMLFRLIVHTGLRLREAYRLRWVDVSFDLRTIHVAKSKTGRSRDVPMSRQLAGWMKVYKEEHRQEEEIVFPYWWGTDDEDSLRTITRKLSARFKTLFEYAGIDDMVEHDLRHEATCRWMLLKAQDGHWMFRPEEVRKITGHKNEAMFMRYLSLRGSELADRLDF